MSADAKLSDDELEQISDRVASKLFHMFMRRLAKATAVNETVLRPPCDSDRPRVKPTAEDFAAVDMRRARKGR